MSLSSRIKVELDSPSPPLSVSLPLFLSKMLERTIFFRILLLLTFWILASPDTGTSEPLPADGDVRLANEGGSRQQGAAVVTEGGNVLVYHSGKWWSVCDDRWSIEAAEVVCRQLGHPGASSHTTQSFFGRPQHGNPPFEQ